LFEGDGEGEHLDNDVDDELLQWLRSCGSITAHKVRYQRPPEEP